MIKYKDKFGNPISIREMEILLGKENYRVIKQEHIGKYWISTVWLPIPHGSGMDENFETMVFTNGGAEDCFRYEKLDEAIKGHEEVVERYKEIKE